MVKSFIAFSGGVESTTLCLLFGHQANAIFADTGDEHQEMYDRLGEVESKLAKIHPTFRIIRVKSAQGALHDYIRERRIFPSPTMRFCTRIFKIEPINEFLGHLGPVALMIGLNADEERTGAYPIEGINFSYPLQDLGLTRQRCIALLKEYDLEPRLPVYMRRGGCKFCFYKSRKEYAAIAHLDPKLATELADFEDEVMASRKENKYKYFTMVREIPEGFRRFFEQEQASSLFSAQEMYAVQPGAADSPCGVFCHR